MTSPAPDTSVVVAGLSSWHLDHELARPVLADHPPAIAHVLIESYSVLTRLPRNQRVKPELALAALGSAFADSPLTVDGSSIRALLDRLAAMGIAGGATYDAVIAETARLHELRLVTLDERATRTYGAVGVDAVFLGSR